MNSEQSIPSGKTEERRNFFGIASISGGLLAFLILLMSFGYAYYMLSVGNTDKIIFIIGNFLVFANGLSIFAGLIFGVVGLFQKHYKKTLSIIGLLLSFFTGIIYCLSITWLAG